MVDNHLFSLQENINETSVFLTWRSPSTFMFVSDLRVNVASRGVKLH